MAIQNVSERALLVTLPREPDLSGDLETAARLVSSKVDHHVIVDFSYVEAMSSVTVCGLIILNRLLTAAHRQLILCSVPPNVAGTLKRMGLHTLLEFAEDECAALQSLDRSVCADG